MPWQNQGGPWGGGGSGGGSGGSGGGSGGPWGRPSGGGGPRQPDIEEMLRRTQDRLRRILPGGGGGVRGIALVAVAALALWVITGFYRVDAGEQGVELIFGRWDSTTGSGLNWNWPTPIGSVETPNVEQRISTEIGLQTTSESTVRPVEEESLMLTGDENIIDIQFVVIWKINDAGKFLFNIRDPEATVKSASEAAMREIVGQSNFERMLTQGRTELGEKTLVLIQQILDSYQSGILVENVAVRKVDPPQDVVDAFRDVQAAKADQQRLINEAQAYFNQVTQRAEGEAQQIIKGAEGYREQTVALATGNAQRFISVYEQYLVNPPITARRFYLETMERILRGMTKVLVDDSAGAGTVPYLPLDQLIRRQDESVPPAAPVFEQGATQ